MTTENYVFKNGDINTMIIINIIIKLYRHQVDATCGKEDIKKTRKVKFKYFAKFNEKNFIFDS